MDNTLTQGDAEHADAMLGALHLMGRAARTTVCLVALGALLAASWQRLRSTHQRRIGSRSTPLPQKLQTWEGEGGRPAPEDPHDGTGNDTTAAPLAH